MPPKTNLILKNLKNAMRAREPNSWPIRYHRTWTGELAVSYPNTIVGYMMEVEDHHLATSDTALCLADFLLRIAVKCQLKLRTEYYLKLYKNLNKTY